MSVWIAAAIILLLALTPCLGVCVLSGDTDALAAIEIGSALTVSILILLSEGFHRQPFIDLALTLALVSVVGSLAFARMLEDRL